MPKLIEFIYSELESGRPVASSVIVSSSGSTPRSTGSRMAMSLDGHIQGTVGGGPGEAQALRESKDVLQGQQSRLLKLDLSGKEAAESGMICGGRQEILIEYLESNEQNMHIFSDLLHDLNRGLERILYTAFKLEDRQRANIFCRTLDPGTLYSYMPSSLKEEMLSRGAESRLPFSLAKDEYTVLVEPMSSAATVFIAGAGHVGQATAKLTAFTGFRTVVLDDRADFLSVDRLPDADKLHQVKGFRECFKDLQVGPESCIVILTRGHVHDKTVLAQALQTSAQYIGMIGSRKKREAIYQALREEGFSQMALERIHCPIGLSIGADTPEEIAVSIVAELIQARSRVA